MVVRGCRGYVAEESDEDRQGETKYMTGTTDDKDCTVRVLVLERPAAAVSIYTTKYGYCINPCFLEHTVT